MSGKRPCLPGASLLRGGREVQQAEPVPDRDQFVVVSAAADAGVKVAGNLGARTGIEPTDDVGPDIAPPLRA